MPSPKKREVAIFSGDDLLLADVIEVGEEQWTTDFQAKPPRLQLPPGHDVRGMVKKYRWHVTKHELVPLRHFDDDVTTKKPSAMRALVRGMLQLNETFGNLSAEDKQALETWQKTIDATGI